MPLPRAADGRLVVAVNVTYCGRKRIRRRNEFCAVPTAVAGAGTSGFRAGRTGSSSRWRPAAVRGPRRWTRSPCLRHRFGAGDRRSVAGRVVGRLIAARRWRPSDRRIWVVMDAGYDAARLAWLLRDLPGRVLARMRSDQVLRRHAPPLSGRRGGHSDTAASSSSAARPVGMSRT
ncbi:transposase [Polymorphospora rubra]|uniref:transposase n=1 Tax=Polymorphospora rubra TaxID=338584 RepID=UPI0033E06400